jgi:hypothetical protein
MAIRIEDIIAFAGLENRNNNQQWGELIGCLEHQLVDVDYDVDFIRKCCDHISSRFGGQINVIPGTHEGSCNEILLALSKGAVGDLGFNGTMQKVRRHLLDCPITKTVVVVSDHWKKGMLNNHLLDLQHHYSRGVRFIFLLAIGNYLVHLKVKIL